LFRYTDDTAEILAGSDTAAIIAVLSSIDQPVYFGPLVTRNVLALARQSAGEVREVAARALAYFQDPTCEAYFLENLTNMIEPQRVWIVGLANLASIRAVPLLIERLANRNLFHAATMALSTIGGKRAAAALRHILPELDMEDRRLVISELGSLGDQDAVAPIVSCILDARSGESDVELGEFIETCFVALREIGNEDARSALRRFGDDRILGSDGYQIRALYHLSFLDPASIPPAVIKRYLAYEFWTTEENLDRVAAIVANCGSEEARRFFSEALRSSNVRWVWRALIAIAYHGNMELAKIALDWFVAIPPALSYSSNKLYELHYGLIIETAFLIFDEYPELLDASRANDLLAKYRRHLLDGRTSLKLFGLCDSEDVRTFMLSLIAREPDDLNCSGSRAERALSVLKIRAPDLVDSHVLDSLSCDSECGLPGYGSIVHVSDAGFAKWAIWQIDKGNKRDIAKILEEAANRGWSVFAAVFAEELDIRSIDIGLLARLVSLSRTSDSPYATKWRYWAISLVPEVREWEAHLDISRAMNGHYRLV
jgi:HEAT repeat protein